MVRESDGRAEAADPGSWLPLPLPHTLPEVDELLAANPTEDATTEAPPQESPARAEPHDATAWLPLPDLGELPSIHELLTPDPDVDAPAPRDHPVGVPSPARAEPHDATAWLPLPEPDGLPHIHELVEPDGTGGAPPRARTRTRRRRFHVPVRSLLVTAVVLGMVGGVYWGATRVLDKGDDVQVSVDNRRISTETGVSTVASLLKEQKVVVGDHDRVVPAPSTPIEDGMTVHVMRAYPLTINVDGQDQAVFTTYHDPQGLLKDLGLGPNIVFRDKPERIDATTPVLLRTKHTGSLTVDGQTIQFDSPSATIQELLDTYRVKLGPADYTTPIAPNEALTDDLIVGVTRVATETTQQIEPYSVPDERQPDPNLEVGQERVQEAKPGMQTVTYNVTVHNTDVAQSDAISQVPIPGQEATPRITFFGTHYNPLWDKMANCETGGNWSASGQRYQGGLGIYFQNWNHYGGLAFAPTAGQATKYEQIIVAEKIRHEHGWRAWGCAKKIGL